MKDILVTLPMRDYELIDSGYGEKLERYGEVIVSRPDPQALWRKNESDERWNNAHASFRKESERGSWVSKIDLPKEWRVKIGGITFSPKLSPFKHIGIFPEQSSNWTWLEECIKKSKVEEFSVLNLFGYTGGASLACAMAGANVVHVDGSKSAITWAKSNAQISGLEKAPIRWILEDARSFVKKELKRGKKYQGIILDPPTYGHGAEKEVWKIENDLVPLIKDIKKLLSDDAVFLLLNGYASGYSAIAFENLISDVFPDGKEEISSGELAIKESSAGRLLPAGIFARWCHRRIM